jgi:hypothetical protein
MNCHREIPETAKICLHCEAPIVPAPTAEEEQAARDFLETLPHEATAEIVKAFHESSTAEEFVNRLSVGNCPACNSRSTGDCENDPEIQETLLARCYDCGQLWCTVCGQELEKAYCPCWDEEPS